MAKRKAKMQTWTIAKLLGERFDRPDTTPELKRALAWLADKSASLTAWTARDVLDGNALKEACDELAKEIKDDVSRGQVDAHTYASFGCLVALEMPRGEVEFWLPGTRCWDCAKGLDKHEKCDSPRGQEDDDEDDLPDVFIKGPADPALNLRTTGWPVGQGALISFSAFRDTYPDPAAFNWLRSLVIDIAEVAERLKGNEPAAQLKSLNKDTGEFRAARALVEAGGWLSWSDIEKAHGGGSKANVVVGMLRRKYPRLPRIWGARDARHRDPSAPRKGYRIFPEDKPAWRNVLGLGC